MSLKKTMGKQIYLVTFRRMVRTLTVFLSNRKSLEKQTKKIKTEHTIYSLDWVFIYFIFAEEKPMWHSLRKGICFFFLFSSHVLGLGLLFLRVVWGKVGSCTTLGHFWCQLAPGAFTSAWPSKYHLSPNKIALSTVPCSPHLVTTSSSLGRGHAGFLQDNK